MYEHEAGLIRQLMKNQCRIIYSDHAERIRMVQRGITEDDVKEVKAGYECGLVFDGFNDVKEEDKVEAYIMVEVPR